MQIKDIFIKVKGNKSLMNGMMFSIYSFVDRGISFILLIVLARYILPADYGRLSLFDTIVQLLGFFVALSSQGFFSVSFFQRKGYLFRQDTTSIVVILIVCTSIISIVLLFSQNALSRLANLQPLFLWYALLINFVRIFYYLYKDYLRIQEKVARYGVLSCGVAVINFALSIYLVIYKKQGWEGRVYSSLICTFLFGIIGLLVLQRNHLFTRHITWDGTKMILLWGLPLIPHQAAAWIKQGCDRLIINGTHTIEDVGIFSFALTLTSIVIMIGTAFNATNSVSIYQILSTDLSPTEKLLQLKRQTRNIGLIYSVGYILVLIFGTVLVPLFLPRYSDSLPFFWILSLSGYFFCLYFLFVNYLFYYHKNSRIMIITFLTALLHLGASLLLTRYSLYYTAIIHVVSQFIVLLLIIRESQRVIKDEIVNAI